mgnify:CR=1 FL=1
MRWVIIAAIVAVALFAWSLTRVSTDALAMAIGMLLGVLAGMTTPAMILLTRREHDVPTIIVLSPLDTQNRIAFDGQRFENVDG